VLACAPAPSEAGQPNRIPTETTINGLGYGPGYARVEGYLESPRRACLARRTIVMYSIRQNGERKRISTDSSSRNGFWGGEGESSTPKAFRVVVEPRPLTRRKTCRGDSARMPVPDFPRPAAARDEFPTTMNVDGTSFGPGFVYAEGSIAARKACRSRRRVEIVADTAGGPVVGAVDRASLNGYFGGRGDVADPTNVFARAPAKQLPGGDSCAEATDDP
jgi:hypothetical protein